MVDCKRLGGSWLVRGGCEVFGWMVGAWGEAEWVSGLAGVRVEVKVGTLREARGAKRLAELGSVGSRSRCGRFHWR